MLSLMVELVVVVLTLLCLGQIFVAAPEPKEMPSRADAGKTRLYNGIQYHEGKYSYVFILDISFELSVLNCSGDLIIFKQGLNLSEEGVKACCF